MKRGWGAVLAATSIAAASACDPSHDEDVTGAGSAPTDPDALAARTLRSAIDIVHEASRFAVAHPAPVRGGPVRAPRPALRPSEALRFWSVASSVTPVFAPEVIARAEVALPRNAADPVVVRDRRTGVTASFRLAGATHDATVEATDGLAVYAGALGDDVDVLHRPTPRGTEDFLLLRRPIESVTYELDTRGFAGLRLVANSLEMVDASGVPRLRMAPPWVVSTDGRLLPISVTVEGCAVDHSTVAPWRRPITSPGSDICRVILWLDDDRLQYPALLDPSWTLTANDLAVARTGHTASRLANGDIFIAGGADYAYSTNFVTSTELYDEATETFAMGPDMAIPRAYHTATELMDGRVLLVAGDSAVTELYDGTQILPGPTLAVSRDGSTATRLTDGRVLIVGGFDSTALKSAVIFDPQDDSVTATASTAFNRSDHSATLLVDGRVLVLGGRYSSSTDTVEMYDPALQTWSTKASMTTRRAYHTSTVLADGRVLVAAGMDELYLSSSATEIFVPPSGAGPGMWTPTPALTPARQYAQAAVLATDQVLIAGGYDAFDLATSEVNIYDPPSNTFASTDGMNVARTLFTLTPLAGGAFLAVGGDDDNGALTSAEIVVAADVGEVCVTAGDCANGNCVDGFCCESSCDLPCESCSAAEKGFGANGDCEALTSGDADPLCPDEGAAACGTVGTCADNGICALAPQGRSCGLRVCADAGLTDSLCNGAGVCAQTTTPCEPFACADATSCATSCLDAEDCGAGSYCTSEGTCAEKVSDGQACSSNPECFSGSCSDIGICSGVGCIDDSTLRLSDGTTPSCAPFGCREGACLVRCESVLDCADGSVCDEQGSCVAPTRTIRIGGCSSSGSAAGSGWGAIALWAALAVLGRRRTGRRARTPTDGDV